MIILEIYPVIPIAAELSIAVELGPYTTSLKIRTFLYPQLLECGALTTDLRS
jgi:hypothetical protein